METQRRSANRDRVRQPYCLTMAWITGLTFAVFVVVALTLQGNWHGSMRLAAPIVAGLIAMAIGVGLRRFVA